ncbi:hypothetical protein SNE40_003739 [Patella caerulea]|uniref:Uncharacterized protein n=1 Tax=Patella caerulea TaxID=87958 RepID=A0AAN8K3L1_PATCE
MKKIPAEQTSERDCRCHRMTRAFYQYLQCLHYIANLEKPSTCFKKKEKELNHFIRPACSNDAIMNKIKVNAAWAHTMRRELKKHYHEQLLQKLEAVYDHYDCTGDEMMGWEHQALSWAKKNYGTQLRRDAVDEFLARLPSTVRSPPPSPSMPGSPLEIPARPSPCTPSPKVQRPPKKNRSVTHPC